MSKKSKSRFDDRRASEVEEVFQKRRESQGSGIISERELDELLSKLTPEELQALNDEVDPDDNYLPASERVKNQTDKAPTGKYDRQHLINFLEEQARNEKDWDDYKPYVKEIKGKVWKPPSPVEEPSNAEFDLATAEWDDLLKNASEPEIVELAAMLGLTGLVNQAQYHAVNSNQDIDFGGWSVATKAETLKFFPPEPENDTDVNEVISQLKDAKCNINKINLNNMKDIDPDKLNEIIELLKNNKTVQYLHMCNVNMSDTIGMNIAELMEKNNTLKCINIESNRLTAPTIVRLVKATLKHQSVTDLRLSNQRCSILGNRAETEIADVVQQNTSLLRLGLHFDSLGPRVKVNDQLKRNMDKIRQNRILDRSKSSEDGA